MHSWQKIDWDDVMAEKEYDKYLQYSRCKLMNHMMAFFVHKLFAKRGCQIRVTSNVIELGETQSVSSPSRLSSNTVSTDQKLDLIPIAVASLLELVESPALSAVSGKYFNSKGRQIRSGADATDERMQRKLWEFSESICNEYVRDC